MIRLPNNRTCVESSLLRAAIKAGLWPGVHLVTGYGPSYGVDDGAKATLAKPGGEIRSPIASLTLIGVPHRGTVGPISDSYWWMEVTVKEFATLNEDGKPDGGLKEASLRAFLYDNRFRFDLPKPIVEYIEGQQARADRRAALAQFAEAAGFVRKTTGWKEYHHPVHGISIDEGSYHDQLAALHRGTNTIKAGHKVFDHFVATGEIITELLSERGDDFLVPVAEVKARGLSPAEAEYFATVPRTVVDGAEYVDMYGRWQEMWAAPQGDQTPAGYRYVSHFGGGAWYYAPDNDGRVVKPELTEAWRMCFVGEITLRVNGHPPGDYEMELDGHRVKYTVLNAEKGDVRVDSLQPFEALQAADDFLSNRAGRLSQAETRRKVRAALNKKKK